MQNETEIITYLLYFLMSKNFFSTEISLKSLSGILWTKKKHLNFILLNFIHISVYLFKILQVKVGMCFSSKKHGRWETQDIVSS